jgi:hypothetical protein
MASEQTRRRAAAQAKRTHASSQQIFGVNGLLDQLGENVHKRYVRARSVESSLSVIKPGPAAGLSTLQL